MWWDARMGRWRNGQQQRDGGAEEGQKKGRGRAEEGQRKGRGRAEEPALERWTEPRTGAEGRAEALRRRGVEASRLSRKVERRGERRDERGERREERGERREERGESRRPRAEKYASVPTYLPVLPSVSGRKRKDMDMDRQKCYKMPR